MKKNREYVVLRRFYGPQEVGGGGWIPASKKKIGQIAFYEEDRAIFSSKEAAKAIKDQIEAAGHRAKIKRW